MESADFWIRGLDRSLTCFIAPSLLLRLKMTAALALNTGTQVLMILLPTLTLVIATCATAARFYARHLKTLSYGADDWLALVALVS